MKCPSCGSKNIKQTKRDHRFVESGLTNVTLRGCSFITCRNCGDEAIAIRNQSELMSRIARRLIFKKGPLLPEEIRFLRSHAGWTNQQVAKYIGVSEEQASRWATGSGRGERMSAPAEALFRAVALVEDFSGEELTEAYSRLRGLLISPKLDLLHKRAQQKVWPEKIVLAA